jgi:hypothetical protein
MILVDAKGLPVAACSVPANPATLQTVLDGRTHYPGFKTTVAFASGGKNPISPSKVLHMACALLLIKGVLG